MWIGATNFNTGMYFRVPEDFEYASSYKFEREKNGMKVNRVPAVCWFTNLEHGRRHTQKPLMSMADNIKYSKHSEIKGKGYQHYDNFDAIEVNYYDAIPSDYDGMMGMSLTYMDKYCPLLKVGSEWQAKSIQNKSKSGKTVRRLSLPS